MGQWKGPIIVAAILVAIVVATEIAARRKGKK